MALRPEGKRVAVTIEPFVALKAKVKRAAGEEAERIAAFMERKLELKWVIRVIETWPLPPGAAFGIIELDRPPDRTVAFMVCVPQG